MAKVFEDEFTDIQADMVSLALEALETAGTAVDKIYIYAFGTEHELFYNLFFEKDGKVCFTNHIGMSDEIIGQVLDFGMEDMEKLRKICAHYGQPAPCQLKLVYDCRSGHFDGDYGYDDLSDSEYGSGGAFDDWVKEIAAGTGEAICI